jgi:hypothetical protein
MYMDMRSFMASTLMMETEEISEMLASISALARLIAGEDFNGEVVY